MTFIKVSDNHAIQLDYKTKLELVSLSCKSHALKQQITKFYPQIQRTDASDHICVKSVACHKCKS